MARPFHNNPVVHHNRSSAASDLAFLRSFSLAGAISGRPVPFQTLDFGFALGGNRVLPGPAVGEDSGRNEVQGIAEASGVYHVQEVVYGQF